MKRSGHLCTVETSDLIEQYGQEFGWEIRRCREGSCGDVFKVHYRGPGNYTFLEELTEDEFEAAVVRA